MSPRSHLRVLQLFVFYALLVNVPFWVAARTVGLEMPGPVSVELIAIGALALLAGRPFLRWLIPFVVLVDILYAVKSTYLFTLPEMLQAASSLPFYAEAHPGRLLVLLALVVLLVGALARAGRCSRQEACRAGFALTSAALVLLTLDVGHKLRLGPDGDLDHRLLRNFSHRMLQEGLATVRAGETPIPHFPGATARIAGDRFAGGPLNTLPQRPDIVLVLVESWGLPLDHGFQQILQSPFDQPDLTARYAVSRGTVPFHGATVSAEARELCDSTLGVGITSAADADLARCLPAGLAARGYHTLALHGFKSRMFQRAVWYPRIGFQELHFLPDFAAQTTKLCPGPFPGLCDADAAAWLGDRLQRNDGAPLFAYWLTLNSHLPVPATTGIVDPASCTAGPIAGDEPLCRWYQLIHNVQRSVVQLALRQAQVRPTIFVVVGDHAPPFASAARRRAFSAAAVPYVILWPRQLQGSPAPRSTLACSDPPALAAAARHPRPAIQLRASATLAPAPSPTAPLRP